MTRHRPSAAAAAAIAFLIAAPTLLAPAALADDAETLHRLFEERHAWELREFPEEAMRHGDYANADRVTDNSLAAIERRQRETVEMFDRLESIDRGALGEDDLVNYELFELRLKNEIDDHAYRMFLAPVGQRFGPHQDIPQMAERVRFTNAEDYDNYLERLAQVPRIIDNSIELLKMGLAEGRTPPQVSILGVSDQLRSLLDSGGLDELAKPFAAMPDHFTAAQRETYPRRFAYDAEPVVREAITQFRDFFDGTYLPAARQSIAATTLPDGEAYYAHQLRKMTTTDMTAREIHQLGLKEVARIRREMMGVIRRSDYIEIFPDDAELEDEQLFARFVEHLRSDPRFYHDDPEKLLSGYRDICKKVDAWLPKFFGNLPRLPYGVRKIPDFMAPQQTTAYYSFGNMENAEPGYFYANTYALDQRPKYEMVALAMHEAVPGHHLQYAIAQELDDAPEFRKNTWFTAFGEGWALYSERLGIEMGLYEDPYDDFGRLTYEMWRACRLVVDPGMHALGWSRDDAIQYMRENTALSERNIETEIDRYIAWPGQATAYKIGELKIRRLRRDCEDAFGRSFDIRAFHDLVLGAGSVPLTVLERRVRVWIRSYPGGSAYD